MTERRTIDDNEALSRFINDVNGLHDALLHEAVLLHPGYVDSRGFAFGDAELPSARLIFQSQSPDFAAVQIDLIKVSVFRFDATREFMLEGEITKDLIVLYLSGKQDSMLSEIRAARAEYKMLGRDFLGPRHVLTSVDLTSEGDN
jgi:hypothetical protein